MTVYEGITKRIEYFEEAAKTSRYPDTLMDAAYGMRDARDNITIEAASCEIL